MNTSFKEQLQTVKTVQKLTLLVILKAKCKIMEIQFRKF